MGFNQNRMNPVLFDSGAIHRGLGLVAQSGWVKAACDLKTERGAKAP